MVYGRRRKVDGKKESAQEKSKEGKTKIPNHKHQNPNKFQYPNSNEPNKGAEGFSKFWSFGNWGLELVCYLVLGIWCFIPT